MSIFCRIEPAVPRLRRLPYPYRGALSIAGDAEGFSAEFFETLMAFLNSRGQTRFGIGLGLEVTASLFFYDRSRTSLAYFADDAPGARRSRHADRLDDYLRAGWIDTNHAFGNFDGGGGFRRAHAEHAYEALARAGAVLPVFTNHGSADNIQNIGRDADYHRGDRPGDAAYHVDLFSAQGVRFAWTDGLYIERPAAEAVPLLLSTELQDGSIINGFRRVRGTGANAPNLTSLGTQIGLLSWEQLYAEGGVVVLYQHLGVLHKAQGQLTPATIEAVAARPDVCLAPFRRLARERDEGRLWVAGLARLLRYADAVSRVSLSGGQGCGVIELHDGPGPPLDPGGLTLYIDPALPVSLVYRKRSLPFWYNGPDETGRYSVTVAWTPLEEIW